jgi:hypothetical protein
MLTHEQFAALERMARATGKPISALIRKALEDVYFERAQRERRDVALASLLSLDAPVGDWREMEEEIIRGVGG